MKDKTYRSYIKSINKKWKRPITEGFFYIKSKNKCTAAINKRRFIPSVPLYMFAGNYTG